MSDTDVLVRIAEIRQENRVGDVSYDDIEWLCEALSVLRGQLAAAETENAELVLQNEACGNALVETEAALAAATTERDEWKAKYEARAARFPTDAEFYGR